MTYKNPLIAKSLADEVLTNDANQKVYSHDCHNLPICKSYGEHFWGCLAGAYEGNRCNRSEKMQIRILNDMNPNAIHKPPKPEISELNAYVNGKA